jgi:rhodanese-related sulfurtransferase
MAAGRREMAKTFMQLVREAMAEVPGIKPLEAHRRMEEKQNMLVVDVRDAADTRQTGLIPGALNVSLGMLPVRADLEVPEEWRDQRLQDRSRSVITTCALGPNGARGAKLLKDMGFTDTCYLQGGMQAWVTAGLPTEPFGSTHGDVAGALRHLKKPDTALLTEEQELAKRFNEIVDLING